MKNLEEIKNLIIQLESKINELKSDLLHDEILIQPRINSIYKVSEDYDFDYLKFNDYRFRCRTSHSSTTSICKGVAIDLKLNNIISLKLKKIAKPLIINGIEINSEVIDVTRAL